ncbi:MAG: NAD(P)/FAD-dependent oxidoreductase [Hyphomicrobiales bacterium]
MIYDFLVIGGGISGASAAYELASHGSVLLLEAEKSAGYHSTGRSAALFTRNYGGPVVRRINAASAPFFKSPPDGFCDAPLLMPRGSLTVAAPGDEHALEPLLAASEPGEEVVRVSVEEVLERVPFLRPDRVADAVFEANVTDIDVAGLHQGYLKGLRARDGVVMTGQRVGAFDRTADHWTVVTASENFQAKTVINAAGAWADQIGRLAGAKPIGLVAKRRTAIIIDAPDGTDIPALPAVDFAGSDIYLKPDAGKLMASPGDATPTEPQDVQPDEMDIAVLADWLQRETLIPVKRIPHSWAGLRNFVTDEAPVVGFDQKLDGFFWLAGQGGYGIMMAPALAQLTALLCASGQSSPGLLAFGLNADELSPKRLA